MDKTVITTAGATTRLRVTDGNSLALTVKNGGSGQGYTIGYGLKVEEGTLMVDAAEAVEADNTKPITSAAVHTEVGNINALLATI